MKKKLLATLMTAVMAVSLFAGCGGSDNSSKGSEGGADGEGEVEEITWMFWDDLDATEDLISKGYGDVIDRYNEKYKGKYHVTPITTNLEEYYTKLNALVKSAEYFTISSSDLSSLLYTSFISANQLPVYLLLAFLSLLESDSIHPSDSFVCFETIALSPSIESIFSGVTSSYK